MVRIKVGENPRTPAKGQEQFYPRKPPSKGTQRKRLSNRLLKRVQTLSINVLIINLSVKKHLKKAPLQSTCREQT